MSTFPTSPSNIKPYYETYPQEFRSLRNLPRQLMRVHEWAEPFVDDKLKRLETEAPSMGRQLKQQGYRLFHYALTKFTDFDYRKYPTVKFPLLSKAIGPVTFAQIPIASMLTLLYLAVIPKRLQMAHRRQRPDEFTTEANDVLIRDVTSFFFLVLALDPAVRLFNRHVMQRGAGLPLVNGRHMVQYSDMAELYALKSPQGLKLLATDPKTREGFKKALNGLNDKGLSDLGFPHLKEALEQFKVQVQEALKHPSAAIDRDVQANLFKPAFEQLGKLDALVRDASRYGIEQMARGLNPQQSQVLVKRTADIVKNFKYQNFLTHYAQAFRVPGDVSSLLITILLAGWAPLALNDQFSLRAIAKYKKEHPVLPKAAGTMPITSSVENPFAGSLPLLPSPHKGNPQFYQPFAAFAG